MDDIKAQFISLIRNNWNPSATNWGNVPSVTSGYMENNTYDEPSILLLGPNESVLGGGETGYSAIQSGTGRPMSRMIGDLFAMCITHERMGLSESPEYVARQMRDELRRIVSNHYDNPFTGVHWISFFSSSQGEDRTRQPIWHTFDCILRYCYDYRL